MKAIGFMVTVALGATAPAQAVRLAGSGGFGNASQYNRSYQSGQNVTFTGRVVGKTVAPPMAGMGESVSLVVKSPNGGNSQVELGPRWYVADQVARVNVGDQVRVIGRKVRLSGRNYVVMARQIVNPNRQVLTLRSFGGRPYWSYVDDMSGNAVAPTSGMAGTIVRNENYTINGVPYGGYVLQTPNGNVNVVTAPQWYLSRQDYAFNVGDYLTVVSNRPPLQIGPNTFYADTIYGNGVSVVLSNGGIPVYQGWR